MMKKILASLKRKYGPLPLWAWTAIAGVGAYLWNRRRGTELEAEAAGPAFAPSYGFGEGGEPDYGDTGAGGSGATTQPAGPEGAESTDLYPDNKLRLAAMQLIDQIRGIGDELGADSYAPELPGGMDVVQPDVPGDVATAAKPTTAAKGVKWGGQTFTSKAALAAFLARTSGATPAAAFKRWAKRHPGAAKTLAGPAPKPRAKPRPKTPQKPSARAPGRLPAKAGKGKAGARTRPPARPPAKQPRPRGAPPKQSPKPAPKPKPKPRRILGRRRSGV